MTMEFLRTGGIMLAIGLVFLSVAVMVLEAKTRKLKNTVDMLRHEVLAVMDEMERRTGEL